MIEIRGNDLVIVTTTTEWDANANNYAGANKVVVQVDLDLQVRQMLTDFAILKADLETIVQRDKDEAKMREDWPALQDVYSQYQMVKDMLVNAKKPVEKKDAS